MTRHPRLFVLWAATALAFTSTSAVASIEGLSSGVTVDASSQVTGITVPGGKTFSTLVTADLADSDVSADCCAQNGINRGGEASALGSANNLNINVPAGNFIVANGWGYTDLRFFGGNAFIKAADNDPAQQDFVLSDFGGNDNFSIQAILTGNTLGERIYIDSDAFGHIQFQDPAGVDYGQRHGFLAFDISDLKDANGNHLPANASIRGLRVYENQDPLPLTGINNRLDLVFVAADVVQGVPEPGTLLLAGFACVGMMLRRKRLA